MRKLKLFLSFLMLFCISLGNVWGTEQTVSWNASSGALGSAISSVNGTASGTISTGSYSWDYTRTLAYLASGKSDYMNFSSPYIQLGSKNAGQTLTFTTSAIPGIIKSITVGCYSKDGNHSLSISVGGTSYYSGSTPSSSGSKSGTGTSSGAIEIAFSVTKTNALYVSSITVVYEETGGSPEPTPSGDPAISADPAEISDVPAAGVTNQTISLTYTNLTNFDAEAILHPNTDGTGDWSGDAWIEASVDGTTLTYSIEANTGAARSASIEVYALGDEGEASVIIPVSQAEYVAPFEGLKLTFDVSSNPGEWPEANSTTTTNYTYTLNSTAYTFALNNVKCNSGYLMLTSTAILGLPAIEGYKLVKIEASNSGGCSTSTKVAVTSDVAGQNEVSGGAQQTWATQSSTYTYNLSGTAANTMYYLYVTNKNSQITSLTLYYEEVPKVSSAVTITNPTHGTVGVLNGESAVSSGNEIQEGTVLTASIADVTGYRFALKAFKTGDESTVVAIDEEGNLTMPAYPITITADETPLYSLEVATVTGGALSWEDSEHAKPTYVEVGTLIQALLGSTTAGYEFVAFDIYKKGDNTTKVDHTDGLFEMPDYNVVIGASFNQKADPEITLSQTTDMDFGAPAKGSANISKTFTVTSANLENDLTVAITSEDDSKAKFSVDVEAIAAADAMAEGGVVVTVTATPNEAGDYVATVTVDDGENGAAAKSFDVLLSVQETYTAKWYVNGAEQTGSTVTAVAGTELTFPTVSSLPEACTGLEFKGWLTSALAEASATAPAELITTTAGITMPENNVDYYAVFAEEVPGEEVTNTYSYTVEAKKWSDNTTTEYTLSDVNWALSKTGGDHWGYDATKGQQIGSGSSPATSMTLSTSGISGKITSVTIYTSGASSIAGTVAVSVNGVAYKNNNNTTASLTATNTAYEFTGSETGEIIISWAQTSSKALYFKQIKVKHAAPSASTYANYVTTCVACSRVTLNAATVDNGSIVLKVGETTPENVKTCEGEDVEITVEANPATGYALSTVNLSGVQGATYADGKITIPENATGTLTATAVFAQENYSVTMDQTGGANATLSENQENKHYGDEITVTAEEKEGYIFVGWEATPSVTFASAKALETTFNMPAENVAVTAKYIQILTVDEALALIPNANDETEDNVYVQAFVSYVNASSFDNTYGTLHYYLSDNGARENELWVYYGYKGENSEHFTDASYIKAGDKVIVCGKLTNYGGTKEFKTKSSYIYNLTVASHESYEVVGELTQTSFMEGATFESSYMDNLKVNDVYTTGYKAEVTGVSFSADKTTLAVSDEVVRVTATKNEETLVWKDFPITVSAATLTSFVLKEGYKTEYYVGETFVKPTVDATLSDNSHVEAEATTCTGYDMSLAGEYTVKVAFTYGDITLDGENGAEYQITVKKVFGNDDAPHTVAVASAFMPSYTTESDDFMYVRGIVSQVNDNVNNNGTFTYNISDDGNTTGQLRVYNGKYIGDVNFTAETKVKVGDRVIVKGKAHYYSNKPELSSSVLISVARTPQFAIADVAEMEVNYTADLGAEDLTYTAKETDHNGAITFATADATIVSIKDNKLHAEGAGTVTITATLVADGVYEEATADFSVTVVAAKTRYTVTFDANGGTGTAPVIANQLEGATVELPANPYSKENSAFAAWVVTETESGDAVTVTDGHFTMPAAAVTIKATWNTVATCAISFQIGGQEVATANAPQTAEYTFTQVGAAVPGFTFLGWSETEVSGEVEDLPTIITSYTPEAGESSLTLYGIYSRVDDSDPNYGKYVKATDVAEGDYLIVCEDQNVAFDGSLTTLDAAGNKQAVAIADGVLTLANADNYVVTLASVTGGYTIKTKSGYYLGGKGSGTNGMNSSTSTEYTNTISISNGDAEIIGDGAYMRCNPNSDNQWFRYFKATTYTSQKAIQLYKKNIGSTVYTSSPVEKVTVTFALAGGEGGCQTTKINKGSELTICAEVPTKTHSEFAGWKNGDDVYVAGTAYTFNEDITLTAQWNTAAKYTVTYAKGGDDVTGSVPTDENSPYFAGDQVTVLGQGTLAKNGYEFQGWLNGNKLYAAAATFAMPAENVTLTAQWRKLNIVEVASEKMTLITDASGLINGTVVALGCSYGENSFAMAGEISSDVMASVTEGVSMSDGIAIFTSSVVMMIAEQAENGWKLRKDETNYLQETAVKKLAWTTSENATVWTISFNNGNAVIANGNNTMKFNKDYPRFTTYASGQTAIQLYGKAIVVTDDVNISDLGYVGEDQPIVASGEGVTLTIDEPTTTPSITATNGATVVIDAPTTAQSVNVEEGSKIEANEPTTTPVVTFATTLGSTNAPSTGSALGTANNITLAAGGEIHYDITLGVNMTTQAGIEKAANQWHAFTVPFPVDVLNGIYDAETGAKLTNEVNYAIMDYHGDIRANGQYGWKKYRGTLVPGVFYIMTVDGDTKTFRFKMSVAANTVLQALNSMPYTAYGGTDATNPNYGWNGIGNPSWVSITVGYPVQVLDPYSYEYQTLPAGTVISASTPFFYKANASSTMEMTESNATVGYAPKRTPANEIKNMAVHFGNEVFADKLYVTASEDALNSYEQDKDLVKMIMSNTPKVAQIFGDAYGMKLSMINTPMVNDQAEVALTLYAPAAGEYTISVPATEGYNVYLTQNGNIIWNLSMSAYTADFAKGNTTGYGIRIVKAPQVTTDLDNLYENESGVQKVIIDEHVFILRGEKMYDVNGQLVK